MKPLPSKRETMRRNRLKREAAAAAMAAEQAWAQERQRFLDERTESFEDTRDWLADTREQAREAVKREPQPGFWWLLLQIIVSVPRRIWRAGRAEAA